MVEAAKYLRHIRIVAGLSYTGLSDEVIEETRTFLQEGTICGIKLYPGYEPFYPSDPKLEPVYALARTHGVPIMFHSGDTFTPKGKLK